MNANELRIGNYYSCASNEGIIYPRAKTIQYNEFGFLSDIDGTNFGICKPIPLTEEWLLRFGFEKYSGWDDQIYWRKKEMDLLVTNQGFEMPSGKICKFVHILQNAYFFTELEELTLKTEL